MGLLPMLPSFLVSIFLTNPKRNIMATFTLPKTHKIVPVKQVHPRVLKEDRNCCDCIYYEPPHNEHYSGECELLDREVGAYDECNSFTRRKE